MTKRNVLKELLFRQKKEVRRAVIQVFMDKENVRDLLSYFFKKAKADLDKADVSDYRFLPPIIVDLDKGVFRFHFHYFGACFAEWLTDGMDTVENNNKPMYWHDVVYQSYVKSKTLNQKIPAWMVYNFNSLYDLFYVGFNKLGPTYYTRAIYKNMHGNSIEVSENMLSRNILFDDFTLGIECKEYEIVYGEKVGFEGVKVLAHGKIECEKYWTASRLTPYVLF